MGVSKISIYNGSITPSRSLEKVLDHYIQEGVLNLKQINTPAEFYEENRVIEVFWLSSQASFNDCMMRYALKSRWVVVLDFDEFITPSDAHNFSGLMNQLFVKEREDEVRNAIKKLELSQS